MLVGLTSVLLLAPVWMQLVHVVSADLVWIAFVLLALDDDRVQGMGGIGQAFPNHTALAVGGAEDDLD